MLKVSKLVLVGALWFGACVQAAQAVPTVDPVAKAVAQYTVPGFTTEDIRFVRDAYNTYLDAIKSRGMFAKTVSIFKTIDPALIDYCNTLLSRFYRSQLDAIAKVAPLNFKILKKAIEVASNGIDQIGADLMTVVDAGNIDNVREEINRLRKANTLKIALNAVDKFGDTALIEACRKGDVDIVKELLSLKDASGKLLVDVNAAENRWGFTALMFACKNGYADIVKDLLGIKDTSGKVLVDVNAVDQGGRTALIKACWWVHVGIVKELLEHGANILHNNNDNTSALGLLHEKLMDASVSATNKVTIRSILKVFDALKPDVTDETFKGMDPEVRLLKDAYVEFQKGDHQELRNVLFEMPLVYTSNGIVDYPKRMAMAMLEIFKPECIRPLITFLQPRGAKQKAVAQVYVDEAQYKLNFQAKAVSTERFQSLIDMSELD